MLNEFEACVLQQTPIFGAIETRVVKGVASKAALFINSARTFSGVSRADSNEAILFSLQAAAMRRSAIKSCRSPAGANSRRIPVAKASNSSGSSPSITTWREKSPCLSALRETLALPFGCAGPRTRLGVLAVGLDLSFGRHRDLLLLAIVQPSFNRPSLIGQI